MDEIWNTDAMNTLMKVLMLIFEIKLMGFPYQSARGASEDEYVNCVVFVRNVFLLGYFLLNKVMMRKIKNREIRVY